ncbi:sugar ABC transporter substrate-binding protein [Nakamurella flavida]|uniref:Sugar ABC transporter substrate-binding protein n=1 Tax=Nakamurella flavida TaxID=363630 RepID=A0A939C788_9ACTN|nr:sugar ABC transporter substrate-binding protein [Nakamurella flavida]MBM9477917.1 sugar ABC transporter substrate-binding protein [Nakamurella flavida]MDP9778368.1 multiple sugar transport system substrate-binding protein [Nakamurella flavida]
MLNSDITALRAGLDRRRFLGLAGAVAGGTLLAGCGGFSTSGSSDATPTSGGAQTLSFTTWGTEAELTGFRAAIARFEQANTGVTVALNAVPYEQMFTNIDAQLQAGNPPDVFRVPYYTFGGYAGRGQLLDLTPHLEANFGDRFTPQAWAAVQNGGKPFGVPHHTDTSVILYNKDALDSAGITSVPTALDQAWTWDELGQVATTLRAALPADKYPMAYNWQGNGVTRWLSLLFQSDGRFLADDLITPAIDSDAGRAALDFSKSFFTQNWVPANNSVKSTTYASDTWYSQTAAMTWGGAFLIPDATSTLDFTWGATFAPRNARAGSDFGGNALVATAATPRAELAAAFLSSLTEADPMRDFCAGASLLPTRGDLVESGIEFAVRPELSPVFVGQASAVQAQDAGQVASPSMPGIITVLKDQLENAFVGGQSTDDTIAALTAGIAAATAR